MPSNLTFGQRLERMALIEAKIKRTLDKSGIPYWFKRSKRSRSAYFTLGSITPPGLEPAAYKDPDIERVEIRLSDHLMVHAPMQRRRHDFTPDDSPDEVTRKLKAAVDMARSREKRIRKSERKRIKKMERQEHLVVKKRRREQQRTTRFTRGRTFRRRRASF